MKSTVPKSIVKSEKEYKGPSNERLLVAPQASKL